MVWGAATSRSSGGRSAVQTTQRHLGLVGLDDRRVELGGGGPAGAHDDAPAGPWPARGRAPTNAARPLVVEDVQRQLGTVRQRQRQRRRARTRGQHDVAHAGPDRLVGQGGAERGGRAHPPIVPRIVLHDAGRHLVRRRLPVVLHRQAALRGGPAPLPGARRRDVVYRAFQLDPTRPAGRRDAGPRGLRRASSVPGQAAQLIDRVTDDGGRGGADVPPRPGRSGPTPSWPTRCCGWPASAGVQDAAEGAPAAGLLQRGPQRRRPGRPGRSGRRVRPGSGRGPRRSWRRTPVEPRWPAT